MSINMKKLEKQLQKALKTESGFVHTDLNGVKHKVTKKDVRIFKNKYEQKAAKNGGFLPLIPLFAGLSALGALAGGAAGIAKAVNDSNHNKEMEKIASERGVTVVRPIGSTASPVAPVSQEAPQTEGLGESSGGALFLNPYQGKGIKDFIKGIVKNSNAQEIGKNAVIEVLKNIAKNGANINTEGGALFLNPYKPI